MGTRNSRWVTFSSNNNKSGSRSRLQGSRMRFLKERLRLYSWRITACQCTNGQWAAGLGRCSSDQRRDDFVFMRFQKQEPGKEDEKGKRLAIFTATFAPCTLTCSCKGALDIIPDICWANAPTMSPWCFFDMIAGKSVIESRSKAADCAAWGSVCSKIKLETLKSSSQNSPGSLPRWPTA